MFGNFFLLALRTCWCRQDLLIYSVRRNSLRLCWSPIPRRFQTLAADQLYTQILSVYPNTVKIIQLLGILAIEDDSLTSEAIEGILGMEEGGLALMLPWRGLLSLIAYDNIDKNKGCFTCLARET